MSSLRLSVVYTLFRQDLYYALKSTRGLLFLVFFGVIWFWLLWKLSSGNAQLLMGAEAGMIMSMFIDPGIANSLFVNRAPTFSAFFYLAVTSVPLFVLFAASDQTANDIGSKYLRFLTTRCTRIEIFIARFLGAAALVSFAYTAICIIAAVIAISVDDNSIAMVLADLPLAIVSLIVYSMPFIALMSLCSTIVGSAGLSALVGISVYVVMLIIIGIVGLKMPNAAEIIGYTLPNATKSLILKLQWSSLINALVYLPFYLAVYGFLGWRIFSKRDI